MQRQQSPEADERTTLLSGLDDSNRQYTSINSCGRDVGDTRLADKQRWTSIRIMYLTAFLSSVAFSIFMSSIFPFLSRIDTDVSTSFLGWVIAAFSFGQMISSILFGYWSNKRRRTREPLLVSMTIFILFMVMYAYLQDFPSSRKWWMLLIRAMIGFGAGNSGVVRSYVSAATSLKERTAAVAGIAMSQAFGFTLGPAFQAACVPIGYPGPIDTPYFRLNMFTTPAVFSIALQIINILLLVFVFKEFTKDDHENGIAPNAYQTSQKKDLSEDISPLSEAAIASTPIDKLAAAVCIIVFFIVLSVFTIFETILTPLTIHELGWTSTQATLYVGVILMAGSVLSILDYACIKCLVKKFDERILLIAGILLCGVGFFVYQPWGSTYPPLSVANSTDNSSTDGGCPTNYDWCYTTPQIRFWQVIVANAIISVGYPMCNVLLYTIYSKVLGPKPQGTLMGLISSAGSLARMLGPIFVSQMYQTYGPRWTFFFVDIVCAAAAVLLIIFYKRLVSFYDYVKATAPHNSDG